MDSCSTIDFSPADEEVDEVVEDENEDGKDDEEAISFLKDRSF